MGYLDNRLTYQSLNEKANQLAYWFQKKQIGRGDFIGILLEPGLDFILCVMAIIQTGAVYLPLDALAPKQRLVEIIEDSSPRMNDCEVPGLVIIPKIQGKTCESMSRFVRST